MTKRGVAMTKRGVVMTKKTNNDKRTLIISKVGLLVAKEWIVILAWGQIMIKRRLKKKKIGLVIAELLNGKRTITKMANILQNDKKRN